MIIVNVILVVLATLATIRMWNNKGEPLEQIKSEIQLLEEERVELLGEFEHKNQLLEVQYLDKKHEINERYMPLINQIQQEIEEKRQKAMDALGITDKYNVPLMSKICELGQIHTNVSPLCDDVKLYKELESISKKK